MPRYRVRHARCSDKILIWRLYRLNWNDGCGYISLSRQPYYGRWSIWSSSSEMATSYQRHSISTNRTHRMLMLMIHVHLASNMSIHKRPLSDKTAQCDIIHHCIKDIESTYILIWFSNTYVIFWKFRNNRENLSPKTEFVKNSDNDGFLRFLL